MNRVLIVEDSPTQAEKLRLLLESEGFEVETAPDGQAGLERCAASRFDLVVSDVLMPGLSGYELCHQLKASPKTRSVPVILLTTLSDPMDIIKGLECGADNFVTKPYEASFLVGRMRNLLATKRLQGEGRLSLGIDIVFLGRNFTITADKEQILGLLVSTYEDVVRANGELRSSQASLRAAEQQLQQHARELARINQELEAFVYTASHDLKEPLRGIEAFSGFLLEDHAAAIDDEGRHCLDVVRDSAVRMRQLIDDLLAFARVGRQRTPATAVDLGGVLGEVLTALRFSIEEAGAEVVVQPELPEITGHPLLLGQLFTNLLGNALKYRRKDVPARVAVAGRSLGAEGVEVTVADNGLGVPPEHRERVFRIFQRLHGREQYPGTGVGLAICKRVVDEHGGTIRLEDTPGGGCTVRLTLRAPVPRSDSALAGGDGTA